MAEDERLSSINHSIKHLNTFMHISTTYLGSGEEAVEELLGGIEHQELMTMMPNNRIVQCGHIHIH